MSEYPDHLNPFRDSDKKKFGRTLSRSFRDLKGFIRQPFRKKKSKSDNNSDLGDVEIRKSHVSDVASYNTLRNNVLSLPSRPTYSSYTLTSPPLPRSRFKERLSRSSLRNTYNSAYDERSNPFSEEDALNPFEEPPIPYRRRKSKKRAPIPPSCSNPDVTIGQGLNRSSKWSLTSSETDYTIDDKSEYSGDVPYSQSLRECLDNFNKEMDTLNKESFEMGGSSPNILESTKDQHTFEETEHVERSKSINSLDIESTREINNNNSDQISSKIVDPHEVTVISQNETATSQNETATSQNETETNNTVEKIINVLVEYEENNVEENIKTEEKKSDIKLEYDSDIVDQQLVHHQNTESEKIVQVKYETIAEVNEKTDSDTESETDKTVIYGTLKIYPFNENEKPDDVERKEFVLDKVNMTYIDEENSPYSIEENINVIEENDIASKIPHSSPFPKRKNFKFENDVILENSSIPQ